MKKMFVVLMACIAMLSISFTGCTTGKAIDSGYAGDLYTIFDVLQASENNPLTIDFVSPQEMVSAEESNLYLQQTSRLQSMFGLGDSNIVYDDLIAFDEDTMRSGFVIGGPSQNHWAEEMGVEAGYLSTPSDGTAVIQLASEGVNGVPVWLVFVAGADLAETTCAIDLLINYQDYANELAKTKATVTCEDSLCSRCHFGVPPPVIPKYNLTRIMLSTMRDIVIGELTDTLQISLRYIEGSPAGIYLTESVSGAVIDATTVRPTPVAVSSSKIEWLLIDPELLDDPMMAAMFSAFPVIKEGQKLNYSVIPSAGVVFLSGIAQSSVASDIECSSDDNCPSEYPSCVEGLCVLELKDKYVEGIGSFSAEEPVIDTDEDNIPDEDDNCPNVANTNQADSDNDGLGNACDACLNDAGNDVDNDKICGDIDNCPLVANTNQADSDEDNVGDVCDNCIDADQDKVCDDVDSCPGIPNIGDTDDDGIDDACDYSIARPVIKIINEKRNTIGQISIVYGALADPYETVSVGQLIPIGMLNKGEGAMLDSQLADHDIPDLIVVGGPCANNVADRLLGSPEVCYEGWTAGTALIQVFLNKVTGSERFLLQELRKRTLMLLQSS